MKTGRRNFMKLLGSTGLAAPLKRIQPAIDRTRVAIAKRVIKILLPANGVYIPQITGCAMIDFFLSMDYPQQIMPCGCQCTPEGDLIEGCEEEKRLKTIMGVAMAPVFHAIEDGMAIRIETYRACREAFKAYVRHSRATVVRLNGDLRAGWNSKTGGEIRL